MLYGATADGVYNYSSGSGYSYGQFTLTPWTLVILTTSYDLEAMTTIGTDGVNYESSQGSALLQMDIAGDDGWEYHYAYRVASASYMWDGMGYVPTSDAASGQMTLSVANVADTEVSGVFYAQANSYASSSIAAVPEPGTYAMLLAGLAGIGTMVRRRRR
ncbi:MAG: PEP-CTERM sorting domain-containing protein [Burkholderiaceae bacterium]|nr:PEP-CTERM sorting domain-containing protein [Burkholderiaceae bacterium]